MIALHLALLLGLALVQAQNWLVQRGEDLSKTEREFIDLSQQVERDRREASRQLEIRLTISNISRTRLWVLAAFARAALWKVSRPRPTVSASWPLDMPKLSAMR